MAKAVVLFTPIADSEQGIGLFLCWGAPIGGFVHPNRPIANFSVRYRCSGPKKRPIETSIGVKKPPTPNSE